MNKNKSLKLDETTNGVISHSTCGSLNHIKEPARQKNEVDIYRIQSSNHYNNDLSRYMDRFVFDSFEMSDKMSVYKHEREKCALPSQECTKKIKIPKNVRNTN